MFRTTTSHLSWQRQFISKSEAPILFIVWQICLMRHSWRSFRDSKISDARSCCWIREDCSHLLGYLLIYFIVRHTKLNLRLFVLRRWHNLWLVKTASNCWDPIKLNNQIFSPSHTILADMKHPEVLCSTREESWVDILKSPQLIMLHLFKSAT